MLREAGVTCAHLADVLWLALLTSRLPTIFHKDISIFDGDLNAISPPTLF